MTNTREEETMTGLYKAPQSFLDRATYKSLQEYESLWKKSVEDPERFWAQKAEELLAWHTKWQTVLDYDFSQGRINWFQGGRLNVSYNCLDRHLSTWRKNKAAIIFEGERKGDSRTFTYQDLYYEVNKFANVLKANGIKKGDSVCLYMPMVPQLAMAMLACARIGAIHSIVFGGFSSESARRQDSGFRRQVARYQRRQFPGRTKS